MDLGKNLEKDAAEEEYSSSTDAAAYWPCTPDLRTNRELDEIPYRVKLHQELCVWSQLDS